MEIYWYDLHGEPNPCCSHGSTMVYPLCYSRQKERDKHAGLLDTVARVDKDKHASLLDTQTYKSLFSSGIYLVILQNHVIRR